DLRVTVPRRLERGVRLTVDIQHSAKLGIVLFHPCTPARMSSSISLARRSAAFLSANPVDSRYTWPLIILRRYQTPPRFTKAILDLLLEPAVEGQAIKPQETTVTHKRQLDPCHLVVQRVPRHAEVLCGRVDIEPARLDGRV